MYSRFTDIHRILDAFLVIFVCLYLLKNIRVVKISAELVSGLTILFFLILAFTLGSFDVATGARHRLKIIIPLLLCCWHIHTLCKHRRYM